MDENEFEFEGKTYVALISSVDSCTGCAMQPLPCYKVSKCSKNDRSDGLDVIFVEKQL